MHNACFWNNTIYLIEWTVKSNITIIVHTERERERERERENDKRINNDRQNIHINLKIE
jgi:hypothetical protein